MRLALTLRLLAVATLPGFDWALGAPPTTITPNGFGTSVMPLTSGIYNITGGATAGSNLFHSFSTFNLGTGDTADFIVSSNIANILARVTGGPSTIDGTITSTVGVGGPLSSANLFFINPAGVMFTANAQVNLGGSFIVSTANYVKFSDGSMFYGDVNHPTQDAGLTSAPVSAFGFLTPTPQPVSFSGTQLSVPAGTGLHVIAGDITLDQGSPDGINQRGTALSAPSGNLTLFSAASPGEVPFSLTTPSAPPGSGFVSATNASFGNITLNNQSSVTINGAGGGNVVIRGGKLTVDNSAVSSLNYGAVSGGAIAVQADQLTVTNGSFIGIDSEPGATAGAGAISVNVASNVTVSTNSQISANTETSADGGVISVVAKGDVTLNDGGNILANTDGAGNSGTVSLQAASLNIGSGNSGLSTVSNGTGNAGTIDVNVANSINMTDDAAIVGDTYGGKGGDISIQALQLNMSGTSLISANTVIGSGAGGMITVVTDSLSIQGQRPLVLAFNKFLVGFTGITAESVDSGNAGSISVTARNLNLNQGAVISTASLGGAAGGPISINCAQGQLSNQSEVSSASFTEGGSVQINATDSFTLSGNSSINTSAGENGGDVTLHVGQLLFLLDSNIEAYAGIVSLPNQTNDRGGNIVIDPEFVILDNSLISANNLSGSGQDGNISNSATYFFTNDSVLHATGTIETTPPDLDLAASLVFLPANLVDASGELRERCERAVNHEFSTFIVVGRGGIESAPEELQPDFGVRQSLPKSSENISGQQ